MTIETGIQWSEFDRNDRLIMKRKIFQAATAEKTEQTRDKFITKLEKKANFNDIEAFLN